MSKHIEPCKIEQHTVEALRKAIGDASTDPRTGASFVNIDTRVLLALIDPMRNEAPAMLEALLKIDALPWVHNAAITNDIEALRRIALAFSEWNNFVRVPILARIDGEA